MFLQWAPLRAPSGHLAGTQWDVHARENSFQHDYTSRANVDTDLIRSIQAQCTKGPSVQQIFKENVIVLYSQLAFDSTSLSSRFLWFVCPHELQV